MNIKTDQILVNVHIHIRGVSTSSQLERDERDQAARETERKVTRRVEVESEFSKAKVLASKYRNAVVKHVVFTPLGNLADAKRVGELRAELEPIRQEIDAHNQTAQAHVIEATFIALPINVALDEGAMHSLSSQVDEQLAEVEKALRRGDEPAAQAWLKRNKNLAALMPAIIGAAIEDTIKDVRVACATLRASEKAGKDLVSVSASLDLSMLDAARGMISAPASAA